MVQKVENPVLDPKVNSTIVNPDWMRYDFDPSPLFLNYSVVFQDPTKFAYGEGVWSLPEGHDPLRPWIGHWRTPTFWISYPTDSQLWFDVTKNSETVTTSIKSPFSSTGSKAYVLPYEYPWIGEIALQPADSGAHDPDSGAEPSPPPDYIPVAMPAFRLLAKKEVKVESTGLAPSAEWNTVRVFFEAAMFGSWDEATKALFEEKLILALNSGPLPHYHSGYVDKHGFGFTTGMHIRNDFALLMTFLQQGNAGLSEEQLKQALPVYHTHLLGVEGAGNVSQVENYKHKDEDSKATEFSGLYNQAGELGTHPRHYTILDDVDETLFLELMHLYYNNKELGSAVALPMEDWSDALSLGEAAEEDFELANAIHEQYIAKRWLLKNHLLDKYIGSMHAKKTGYKNEGDYYIYQDKVFNLRGKPANLGDREGVLNYIAPKYDKAINLLSRSQHYLIPNPFLLGQFKEEEALATWQKSGQNARFPKNKFSTIYSKILTLGNSDLYDASATSHVQSYMQTWSDTVIKNIEGEFFELSDVFPDSEVDRIFGFPKYSFMSKYAPYPLDYPWYAKLNINTIAPERAVNKDYLSLDRGTFINDIFLGQHDADLGLERDSLMLFFMSKVADKHHNPDQTIQNFYIRDGGNLDSDIQIETYDFTDLIGEYVYDNKSEVLNPTSNKLISFDPQTVELMGDASADSIENALIEFKDKIEEFQNTRSVFEILDATIYRKTIGYDMHPFAHSEVMFYEVEKKQINSLGEDGTTVQRYFIAPPFSEKHKNGLIEFVDAQLKLDMGYQYNVYAHTLVVGNSYQYANIQTRGFELLEKKTVDAAGGALTAGPIKYYIDVEEWKIVSEGTEEQLCQNEDGTYSPCGGSPTVAEHSYLPIADIFTLNRPKVELLKIPYTKFQTLYIANKPPLHPNLVIYPYKNINNKLLFLLSQFVGEKEEMPIEILPKDKDLFMKAALAQGAINADDMELPSTLKFKSDEPDVKYQVFRLEQHPSAWSDFATALRKPVLEPNGTRRSLKPFETDFIDDLQPNKKYYYIFRTVDSREYVSNPSPIYEVELVDDSGAVYLITKIVKIKPKIPKESTKSMRKYIHIAPTLKQSKMFAPSATSIEAAEGLDSGAIHFGGLFGKDPAPPRRFKIRFTSKSSCKKFDLNLNFVHKHEGLSAEFGDPDPEFVLDNTLWSPIEAKFTEDMVEVDKPIGQGSVDISAPPNMDKPY